MKKIILIFAILGIFFLLSKLPAFAFSETPVSDLLKVIGLTNEEDDFSIFSDSNLTQPTHNFSPRQMVYVKVESFVTGDREKTLRLLDAEKREIQRFELNQSGNIFTVSFAAPDTPGIYYVDIKIKDSQGSVYSSQENITVGQVSGQSVSSEAVAIAETEEGQAEAVAKSIVGEKTEVTPESEAQEKTQPTPELESEEKGLPKTNFLGRFFDALFGFLRKFFRFVSPAARRIPKESPQLPTKVGSSAATNEESPNFHIGGGFNFST